MWICGSFRHCDIDGGDGCSICFWGYIEFRNKFWGKTIGPSLQLRMRAMPNTVGSFTLLCSAVQCCAGLCRAVLAVLTALTVPATELLPLGTLNVKFGDTGETFSWSQVTSCIHNLASQTSSKIWVDHYGEVQISNSLTGDTAHMMLSMPKGWHSSRVNYDVTGELYSGHGAAAGGSGAGGSGRVGNAYSVRVQGVQHGPEVHFLDVPYAAAGASVLGAAAHRAVG